MNDLIFSDCNGSELKIKAVDKELILLSKTQGSNIAIVLDRSDAIKLCKELKTQINIINRNIKGV